MRRAMKQPLKAQLNPEQKKRVQEEMEAVVKSVKASLPSILAPKPMEKDRQDMLKEDIDGEIEAIEKRLTIAEYLREQLTKSKSAPCII